MVRALRSGAAWRSSSGQKQQQQQPRRPLHRRVPGGPVWIHREACIQRKARHEQHGGSSPVCRAVSAAVHHSGVLAGLRPRGALHVPPPGPQLDLVDPLEPGHGTSRRCKSLRVSPVLRGPGGGRTRARGLPPQQQRHGGVLAAFASPHVGVHRRSPGPLRFHGSRRSERCPTVPANHRSARDASLLVAGLPLVSLGLQKHQRNAGGRSADARRRLPHGCAMERPGLREPRQSLHRGPVAIRGPEGDGGALPPKRRQDPGISARSPPGTYRPFDDGLKRDVFIKNATGHLLLGEVWPGLTAFPDFTNPETARWWQDCIVDFYSKVPVDGLWIDMNEPTSFVSGSTEGCPDTELENPPYTPRVLGGRLSSWTLCMSARQKRSAHYDLHNTYGLTQAFATHRALVRARGRRPFVLSRSSFPSIGRFSGVWTGDVRSDWEQLAFSIPSVLRLGLFGVPLAGADVCGFGGDAGEELCVRWTQLGAFYPFMRNHNDRPNAPQEPFVFGAEARAAMRDALRLRYSLLPFLYTLFHHAHARGDTVARPLFLEFPADPRCRRVDRQFLWGSCLLVSPVLEEGASEVSAYLPPGTWYDLRSGRPTYSRGDDALLPAPLDVINIHVREGHIIPMQEPALTTTASRKKAFLLTAALSAEGSARGDLFWDDGDGVDTFQTGNYSYLLFTAKQSQVTGDPLRLNGALDGLVLGGVRVLGVPSPPRRVFADGEEVEDFAYDADTKVSRGPPTGDLPEADAAFVASRRFCESAGWPCPCQTGSESSGNSDATLPLAGDAAGGPFSPKRQLGGQCLIS
ncbi:lysosomal alpha-glucosidase isoform X8 [Syngnathoides biaculeatus]|uniref:lysosomal alpha-glucosidase isoform X8 n=1 Tax=Syngnathoides biaculeatus TaxID=300417 RepID=UPI002ADD3E5E|nr:lysosomal alpha-glucosidase isoform X8 [Syngnathoides biaculeatus]